MKLEDLLKDKKVLLIPVYSARSYDGGIYDLAVDGNMSKYLIKAIKSNAKLIDMFVPENSKNVAKFKKVIEKNVKCGINFIHVKYGENAKETRNMGKQFIKYIEQYTKRYDKQYDCIVSEIDTLALEVVENDYKYCNKNNFIYWAGTHSVDGKFWSETSFVDKNKFIAENVTTACLVKGQEELYGGKSFYDLYEYEPKYFEKKVIFFPFRLSDKSYKLELLLSTISKLLNDGVDNFVFLYTDINDSHLLDLWDNDIFIKVSKDKYVYQAILKGKPIIPFLDDLSKNSHSNIFEFTYYNCDVIMYKNNIFDKVTQITSDEELYDVLKKKLED